MKKRLLQLLKVILGIDPKYFLIVSLLLLVIIPLLELKQNINMQQELSIATFYLLILFMIFSAIKLLKNE